MRAVTAEPEQDSVALVNNPAPRWGIAELQGSRLCSRTAACSRCAKSQFLCGLGFFAVLVFFCFVFLLMLVETFLAGLLRKALWSLEL